MSRSPPDRRRSGYRTLARRRHDRDLARHPDQRVRWRRFAAVDRDRIGRRGRVLRGSALLALGYVARSKGALDDEAMRAVLRRLRRDARPREMPVFWLCWAAAAAALGYEDLKVEVAVLTKDRLLDAIDFGLEDFDRIVELARSDPAGLDGFHDQHVRPLDDAIEALKSWVEGDGDLFESDEGGAFGDELRWRRLTSTPSATSAATIHVPAAAARNTRSAASPSDLRGFEPAGEASRFGTEDRSTGQWNCRCVSVILRLTIRETFAFKARFCPKMPSCDAA